MTKRHLLAGPVALLSLLSGPTAAWSQTAPAIDAGQLLEQQRRLEQQRAVPSQPRSSPLREPAPAALPDASGQASITVRRLQLSGNTLLSDDALQAVLQPWLGRPAAMATLRRAATAIEQAYRDAGRLAQVTLPRQDVTDGEVRFEIAEARLGRVLIAPVDAAAASAGPRAVPPRLVDRVLAMLEARLAAGEALDLDMVQRTLLIAGELPGVNVTGSLQAGTAPGTTDVLLQLVATPLARTEFSADNAANRATGIERVGASLTLDSPWGWGERLALSVNETRGTDYLRGAASVPVGPWGWRVGVNASALRYRVLDEFSPSSGLAPRGNSHTTGLEAQVPLVRDTQARWSATFGLEQRRQINEDDSATPGLLQTTSQTRSRTASFGVSGYAFDQLGLGGQTQASLQVVSGRLDLDGSSDGSLFGDAATQNVQGEYQLLRWNLSRLQSLTPTLSIAATASGQLATRNLDSSEKFYLGGLGAVDAYPSGEAGGSSGMLMSLELRQQLGSQWQVSGFYDWGQVAQYHDNQRADGGGALTPVNTVTLRGPGASLGWHANGVRIKAILAHRIGANPLANANGSDTDGSTHMNRFWLSAGIEF